MTNEQDKQHLQELLSAYRFTVENLQAFVVELEAQLAAAPQAVQALQATMPVSVDGVIKLSEEIAYMAALTTAEAHRGADVSTKIEQSQELKQRFIAAVKAVAATNPTQQGLDAQNPQNAVLDLSARPTVQIHWAREGDPNVFLHSVSVDMDGSCTTAGVLEAVAAAINDYAKQARKKYGGGIPWDTMNFTNVSMHSRDADGDGASIDGHSVIVMPNKPPHGITISHPAALAAQAKQGGV